METSPTLKTLLQVQLASDTLAVLHLPFILSTLSTEVLQASAHTSKWTTRINSLIHSRDAAARWAGLCIAQQTAVYSRSLLLECAQGWVTVVLPLLSVRVSLNPIIPASLMDFVVPRRKMRVFQHSRQLYACFGLSSRTRLASPNSSARSLPRMCQNSAQLCYH